MNWINENKDWLFSGLAVSIPIAIIGWIITSKTKNVMKQKGGKNSTNIQGQNITIGESKVIINENESKR